MPEDLTSAFTSGVNTGAGAPAFKYAINPGQIMTALASAGASVGQYALGRQANEISRQNLAFQQSTLDWQKALQKQVFQREDTSVQRRVADLKAAGLSPVLAAGQGARAGEAISVTTPQRGTEGLKMQAAALTDFAGRMIDVQKSMAEIDLIKAQARKTELETYRTSELLPFEKQMKQEQISQYVLSNRQFRAQLESNIIWATERANQSQIETAIRALEKNMSGFDWAIYEGFIQYLNEQSTDGGKTYPSQFNPMVLEYLAKKAAYDLKKMDVDFYKSLRTGGASVTTGFKLLETILRAIK